MQGQAALQNAVAPYVGAWIETDTKALYDFNGAVAPYVGAWIETSSNPPVSTQTNVSHPTWVRGLKLLMLMQSYLYISRTLRGCVD